jgi:hypothetical protein
MRAFPLYASASSLSRSFDIFIIFCRMTPVSRPVIIIIDYIVHSIPFPQGAARKKPGQSFRTPANCPSSARYLWIELVAPYMAYRTDSVHEKE